MAKKSMLARISGNILQYEYNLLCLKPSQFHFDALAIQSAILNMETKFAEHTKHPSIPRVQNMFQHEHSIFPKCSCKISYKKSNSFLSAAYTQTDAPLVILSIF